MSPLWAALALGISFLQNPAGKEPEGPVLGPMVPAGSHAEFQRACRDVQEAMERGDFASAERLQGTLPRLSFTLAWDSASIPAALRKGYADARDRAINTWTQGFPNCQIKVVEWKKGGKPTPDLAITFVDSLPQKADDPLPPGAVHFLSRDPDEPRVEAVIGLKRGAPSVPSDVVDVHNEVAYAVMQYYGVERSISFGNYSARSDVPVVALSRPSNAERSQVNENLRVVAALEAAIAKRQKTIAARPRIQVDSSTYEGGRHNQGDIVRFGIQITNLGNAPLQVRLVPDCTCVASLRVTILAPNETRIVPAQINLLEVVGDFNRSIVVYANDPDKTVTRVPIHFYSKPVYRLLPENDGLVLMPDGGTTVKVFLAIPEGVNLKALDARLDGVESDITFEPWSGSLADPGMNEGELPRRGYVFHVRMEDRLAPGRTRASFLVLTDHPVFKEIETVLSIQKGIVALPDDVRLGEISASPRRAVVLLSRPRKGFAIRKIETNSPFLKVEHEAVRDDWEYRLTIQFDGRSAPGPLRATITVHTDDPKQPVMTIPYSAMVR